MDLIDAKIEQSIPGRVEKIVERYPERIAFKNKHIVFTWDALDRGANRFARTIVDLAATPVLHAIGKFRQALLL
jgi:hypothetical protein